jgi:hypothetical protein
MRADELIESLRVLYPSLHGWMLLPQVRDGTGWKGKRTADAIAMNAWPSRGLEVHGFELKTYRGDWLRELKQPEKAESVFAFCDRWWIVTPEPVSEASAIVSPSELPPTWGLITVNADGRPTANTPAPKLMPAPLDRTFIASILRSLQKCETPEARVEAAFKQGRDEGFKAGQQSALHRLSPGEAEVVRWKRESLESLEDSAKRILKSIQRELVDVKKIPDMPVAAAVEEA